MVTSVGADAGAEKTPARPVKSRLLKRVVLKPDGRYLILYDPPKPRGRNPADTGGAGKAASG
jgi:hypothetical protein